MIQESTQTKAKTALARVKVQTPLPERAYRAIKEAILSLQLEPGAALVENELAAQLGISKIPLREALHQLENEGLVTRIPYKGVYVSRLSLKEAAEITAVRGVLEGLAARLAAKRINDEQLAEAERILDEAEHALNEGNKDLCVFRGKEFHDLIIALCGNTELPPLLQVLDDRFHRFRLMSNEVRGRTAQSQCEHRMVLEALKRRDPDAVELAMRHHLASVSVDLERQPE